MRLQLAVAVAALALTAMPGASGAEESALRQHVFTVDYDARAARGGSFTARIDLASTKAPVFVAVARVKRLPGGDVAPEVDTAFVAEIGLAAPITAYGNGSSQVICPPPFECEVDQDGGTWQLELSGSDGDGFRGSGSAGYTWYLAVEAEEVDWTFKATGRGYSSKSRNGGFRRALAQDSTAAGAHWLLADAEAFQSASAEGGARGSVGIGTPPCADSHLYPSVGYGSGTLVSGAVTRPVACSGDGPAVGAATRAADAWTLSGSYLGVGTLRTRVTVIDF